ncbi:C4-dicarboxylate ABC transporter permease [Terasakiispira papahanaumokuakeensis]|uniref:TRAP transporter small permease protein n=1 Tax=Terasakiispira papahanaumokuakeensis TaxID=197479 RepID=A0A1E2V8B7_9GAMM|nr:TRAP transporter small permease [Terasakiispira papahanaumokuakeensis]ODC03250.1 C4-dicarboxylate ABC transporter permease [Terasakiispira papahanaumokuakeensis]
MTDPHSPKSQHSATSHQHIAPSDELSYSPEFEHTPEKTDLSDTTWVDRWVEKGGQICAWLVLIAMLISVYEVIMRYAFDSPTTWVHETTTFLVASIFALGGPYTLARNRHIQITLLQDAVGPRSRHIMKVLQWLLGIGFCVAIGYACWVLAWKATHTPMGDWRLQTSGSSWNSPLPAYTKIMLLLAVVVMSVQMLARGPGLLRRRSGGNA